MRIKAPFSNFSHGTKLLVFLLVILFFYVISSLAGAVAVKLFLHIDFGAIAGLMMHPDRKITVEVLYIIQVIGSLGGFILAPLFFVFLTNKNLTLSAVATAVGAVSWSTAV